MPPSTELPSEYSPPTGGTPCEELVRQLKSGWWGGSRCYVKPNKEQSFPHGEEDTPVTFTGQGSYAIVPTLAFPNGNEELKKGCVVHVTIMPHPAVPDLEKVKKYRRGSSGVVQFLVRGAWHHVTFGVLGPSGYFRRGIVSENVLLSCVCPATDGIPEIVAASIEAWAEDGGVHPTCTPYTTLTDSTGVLLTSPRPAWELTRGGVWTVPDPLRQCLERGEKRVGVPRNAKRKRNAWEDPSGNSDVSDLISACLADGTVKMAEIKQWGKPVSLPTDLFDYACAYHVAATSRRLERIDINWFLSPGCVGIWWVTSKVPGHRLVLGAIVRNSERLLVFVPATAPASVWDEVEKGYKMPEMRHSIVRKVLRIAARRKNVDLDSVLGMPLADAVAAASIDKGWWDPKGSTKESVARDLMTDNVIRSEPLPWEKYTSVHLAQKAQKDEAHLVDVVRRMLAESVDIVAFSGEVIGQAELAIDKIRKADRRPFSVVFRLSEGATRELQALPPPEVKGDVYLSKYSDIKARNLLVAQSLPAHCSVCGRGIVNKNDTIGPFCRVGLFSILAEKGRVPTALESLGQAVFEALEEANGISIPQDLIDLMTSEVTRQQKIDPTFDSEMIQRARALRVTAGQVSHRLKAMRMNEDD